MIAKHHFEAAIARRMAFERWGATGFHCGYCGNDRAWQLKGKRCRVFQCTACRKQISVTSGTALEGTKLDLTVWQARGEWHEQGQLPSSRGFAAEQGIAPSSAWHLNQRFMKALELGEPEHNEFGGCALVERLPCRRPRATPPLPDKGHPYVRDKMIEFLEAPRGQRLLNSFLVGPGGTELVLLDPCASPEVVARTSERSLALPVLDRHPGFERFLKAVLVNQLRTVCVRWLTRYLRCILRIWSGIRDPRLKPVCWPGAVLARPTGNLAALRAAATT